MSRLLLVLLAVQVGLPALLAGLNAALPAASLSGLLWRIAAIGLGILYLTAAGLWLFPPWWTPWLLLGLHLLGSVYALRRFGQTQRPRHALLREGERILGGLGALVALAGLVLPAQGHFAPQGVPDLAMPLGPGHYLVASGGATATLNAHLGTLADERFHAWRGQSFALDIVGLDRFGLTAPGIEPADPGRYVIHGTPVLAPCAGTVLGLADGLPDLPVPQTDRAHPAGNHVMLECGEGIVVLAHLLAGSIPVAVGEAVTRGAPIGRVGNSGNTSQPHLHIHMQRDAPPGEPFSGEPAWFTLGGRFFARNDRFSIP